MLRWTTISSPRASRVALHQVANVQVPFIFKWTIDLLNESEAAVDVAANATILGLTSAGTLLIGCESPALTAHVRDGCRQRSLPRPPARGLATRCSVGTLAKATLLLLALAWASSSASDPCDSCLAFGGPQMASRGPGRRCSASYGPRCSQRSHSAPSATSRAAPSVTS